jgi:hypothetical protein
MESRSVRPAIVILAGALLILAAWAKFVWVWSATVFEPWIPIAVTLPVPALTAFASVQEGMRSAHVLTWVVPSSLLILLAFVSRPHPITYLAFTSGLGLPLLLMYSSEVQTAWFRFVLRLPDRGP